MEIKVFDGCNNCRHFEVCMHTANMQKIIMKLKDFVIDASIETAPLTIEGKCSKFLSNNINIHTYRSPTAAPDSWSHEK